jgi:vitamin B12 transporter
MKNFSFAQRARVRALAVASAAACASFAPTSFAQTAVEPQLKPVVVTATRNATKVDELVSELVVVDRAQIDQSTGRTLTELLARAAGVQFSSNGGLGKSTNVYIRGTEARHTILLVDGVRVGSATLGTPSWENIPLDMIERVEVLKGPASALYGSDGVGGVVQIFTRDGKTGFFPSAAVAVGSEGYRQLSAGVRGAQGDLNYSFGLQSTREKGFSATNSNVPFGSFNSDDDGFQQNALSASLRWKLAADWAVDARLLQANGTTQYDDGPTVDARSRIKAGTTSLGLQGKPGKGWMTRLSFAKGYDKATTLNATDPTEVGNFFNTTQEQFAWKNDVDTAAGIATLGYERLKQNVHSTTNYTIKSRTVNSLFAGINGAAGAHSWQANVRHDKNSQFGNSFTGFAGYGFAITPQWRLNVSHGTSFVAPSFNQLYFPMFGTPDLQPEKGRNTDLGIAYSAGGHKVKLVRFDNKIRGFITSTTAPANIPKARIDGWTLTYDGKIGPWSWRAGFDDFDPRNELTGNLLPRRNRTQLNLGADYDAGIWSSGVQLLKAGSRFDNAANTALLDDYTVVDVYGQYKLRKDWALQAKFNNLTNRQYQTVLGYNQPGRSAYLTLRYQPQ